MPSFSTITELSQYIKDKLAEVNLNEVKKEAEKQYKRAVKDTVYRSSSEYSTGSFLESINSTTKRTKHTSSFKVFPDQKKMMVTYPSWSPELFGSDHKMEIGWWLEEGTNHSGKSWAPYQGRFYYRLVLTQYFNQKVFKETVIKALSKHGIQAT